jgi:(S)-2-hydroxyglutarate dehydrogenase
VSSELVSAAENTSKFDIAVVGAGILGVSIAYWISQLCNSSICLIDREQSVAQHTSSRNTGVIHRPFYLDPQKKRVFARAAQKSYSMWNEFAKSYGLPWRKAGTLELATRAEDITTLERYKKWSLENGMEESEIQLLDATGVSNIQPEVKAYGGILSKTDTCVDYGAFTCKLFEIALKNGIKFIRGFVVKRISENLDSVTMISSEKSEIRAQFMINAGGGGSLKLAHSLGAAMDYADLNFRGEYRTLDEAFAGRFPRNIYTVAKYKEFPFLDPHVIIRADGRHEIGPNAVLVFSPYSYSGLSTKKTEIFSKIFARPISPKLRLFMNKKFLSLAWDEWRSSVSQKAMCERVKKFLPSLEMSHFKGNGIAGVRSSLVNSKGFVPEAVLIEGNRALHILNYNSPGATGAPAYSAYVVKLLLEKGHLKRAESGTKKPLWTFEDAIEIFA